MGCWWWMTIHVQHSTKGNLLKPTKSVLSPRLIKAAEVCEIYYKKNRIEKGVSVDNMFIKSKSMTQIYICKIGHSEKQLKFLPLTESSGIWISIMIDGTFLILCSPVAGNYTVQVISWTLYNNKESKNDREQQIERGR